MHAALTKRLLILTVFLSTVVPASLAQEVRRDTLRLEVYFQRGVARVDPSFRGNEARLEQFRDGLSVLTARPGAQVQEVVVRSSVSPEGTAAVNARLSDERAQSIEQYLTGQMGLDPAIFRVVSGGEDWDGLAARIAELDAPWAEDALTIINDKTDPEERKSLLKMLEGGAVWSWLDANIFPDLRSVGGSIACIIQQPAPEPVVVPAPVAEPVAVVPAAESPEAKPDTVYVEKLVYVGPQKKTIDTEGRRFIMAARTNILAVPLANFGIEVPLGEHWSLGSDLYYPWMWRKDHHEGLDYLGWCFELMAVDVEARYWFNNRRKKPEQRLLGHSLSIYAAAGQYDFEWDWSGHQGEFYNAGIDYLYACPVWGGRMHMEFELGVGYIYSPAQPYDTFVEGGRCFRRPGVKQYVSWFGPTRAQVSLVLPFYTRKKGGKK
jgi:hypothetical protein